MSAQRLKEHTQSTIIEVIFFNTLITYEHGFKTDFGNLLAGTRET